MTITDYKPAILAKATITPKNIFELMESVGVWESTSACSQIEYLVDEGFLMEHHRDGAFFQSRYFVKP